MAVVFDRPPSPAPPPPPDRDREREVPSEPPPPRPTRYERYMFPMLMAGLSVIVTAIVLSPLILGNMSRFNVIATQAPAQAAAAARTDLVTNVTVTASEFKFGPSNVQVPVGQKITFTLHNTGTIDHDLTIQGTPFSIAAKPGQTTTGEFTFDKPGTFDFYCSIAGHKEAGMKGSLTVVDPSSTSAPMTQSSTSMADMPGMSMSMASAPDIKPLPANLKPLPAPQMAPPTDRTEPAYVKFDLTTQRVTAQMADGVAYEYWTFNGTVPGPMLRVREGDTVEIDLHNDADAGVTHSIDLHAVTGPGGGAKVMQIAPNGDGSFTFEALNPGVYVYHCATPMVAQHIASGMYGMIVVEPKAGLPKVDREYYLMEGDFYLQGQRGDTGLRPFDLNKMLDERPDFVLFNGAVGSLTGDNALHANVGQTIRVFFGDGGPNLTSSFHIIGAIFDRVSPEGSLTSPPETNVQTTHVSTGGATMVEF
ncbi:MAG: multicopper oxidase domain-containing protein, partial [Chloroflexi bacterium]|nr:multicopper oxidase domain-containing protein [Chloroflexota bacterium]